MEMTDKLDRKEFFMQNKERKWLEIEKILEEKDPDFIEEYDEEEDYQEDEDQSFDDKILEGFHKDTEEEEVEKNKKAKKKRGGFPSLGFGGKGGANAQQHKANKKSFMSTAPLSAFF